MQAIPFKAGELLISIISFDNILKDIKLIYMINRHNTNNHRVLSMYGFVSLSLFFILVNASFSYGLGQLQSSAQQSIRAQLKSLGSTQVHCTSYLNRLSELQGLVSKGACVNTPNSIGMTPLHYAAQQGNTGVIRYLTSKGANQNTENAQGLAPLHVAALNGHAAAVDAFTAAGAEEERSTHSARTNDTIALCSL